VRSAHRTGSLDSAIRDHESNQLSAFIDAHPNLRALAFNGGKAAKLGRNQVAESERLRLVDLPSSSPAYTLSFERKAETWLHLRDFLSAG
jgi:TDG/mug DNA glycosylase family protein